MPFQRGDPKPPNSGRRKGTPNKITREVAQQLADLGCNPVEGLALIAMNDKAEDAIRVRCYSELLEYVKPKLSRHEVVGPLGADGVAGPVRLEVHYVDAPKPE